MGTPHTPQFPTLLVEESGDTVRVRLNRPGKANAVNRQMLTDLIALCDWLEEREDVHFVVLTNEGKVFAAGQDLGELHAELSDEGARRRNARTLQHLAQEMMRRLENLEQITFVAMLGSAYGAGMAIALTGDFRVMAEQAVGNLPETRLGMFLTYGSMPRLVRMVGLARAKEFVMFAEDATAEELRELGVVQHVRPAEEVLPFVEERIARLREMDYRSLRLTKRVAHAAAPVNLGDVLLTEPDLVEGALADGDLLPRLEGFLRRPR